MVIHHTEVGRRVTRWTAEVHALADMGLNGMSLKLIHPPAFVMVCYFCTAVPDPNGHYFRGYARTRP